MVLKPANQIRFFLSREIRLSEKHYTITYFTRDQICDAISCVSHKVAI